MSDEPKTIAALRQDIVNLMADNFTASEKHAAEATRLRALIKAQEWGSDAHGDPACPWCPALRIDRTHLKTCPAFTPEGEVR